MWQFAQLDAGAGPVEIGDEVVIMYTLSRMGKSTHPCCRHHSSSMAAEVAVGPDHDAHGIVNGVDHAQQLGPEAVHQMRS